VKWLINWLNKKALKNIHSVQLSTGLVYLNPLNNGMVNRCKSKSCIASDVLNDAYFFQLMDYELTNLTKRQIDNLSVKDGKKLRNAVKEILRKQGVIRIEAQGQIDNKTISVEDAQKLQQMKKETDEAIQKWQKEQLLSSQKL